MPSALIADDEEVPRAQLLMALRAVWPELQVVAECIDGVDAWDAFLEHEPEVCFLDVRMPGLTGIEVAQRIGTRAHVVFVTARGDHALAAFDAGAVDYVLKPVDAERLAQSVPRAEARLASPGDSEVLIRTPLKELTGQVDPATFWQIHRSTIANGRHIASAVRGDEGDRVLTLRGRSEKLPVSRHFQGLFCVQRCAAGLIDS